MANFYETISEKYRNACNAYDSAVAEKNYEKARQAAVDARNVALTFANGDRLFPETTRRIYKEKVGYWDNELRKLDGHISGETVAAVDDKKPTEFKPTKGAGSDITFKDIAGLDSVKEMLINKVVLPIKNPDVIHRYKKKSTSTIQILLYGPPGTGKSMFAEALANELGMSVHRALASEIIDSKLGGSIKNMRAYMDSIMEDDSERILAFIDEFDALAPTRTEGTQGADAEMNRMVNELLQGIDDMVKSSKNKSIVFLATTNRPWGIDPAILRGKRLDTQIYVGLPDLEARKYLVNKALGGGIPPLAPNIDLNELARQLIGYSAADIATICDKICDEPLFRHYQTGKESVVTIEDIRKVTSLYRKSVTPEILAQYERYNRERGGSTPKLD